MSRVAPIIFMPGWPKECSTFLLKSNLHHSSKIPILCDTLRFCSNSISRVCRASIYLIPHNIEFTLVLMRLPLGMGRIVDLDETGYGLIILSKKPVFHIKPGFFAPKNRFSYYTLVFDHLKARFPVFRNRAHVPTPFHLLWDVKRPL